MILISKILLKFDYYQSSTTNDENTVYFSTFQLNDWILSFVSIYDGTCDQTKELETLSGTMSNEDKWIISSSGHHMFVSFTKSQYFWGPSKPGFLANIHYGKKLKDI